MQVFIDESGTARQSRYLAMGALSFRRGHGLVSNQLVGVDRIASVVIDHITPPGDVNYEGYIASAVNRTAGRLAVAGICRVGSRACWGLQLADILTGATAHQYRQATDASAKPGSPKGQLAAHVAEAFNRETLVSARSTRFSVVEGKPVTRPKRRLKVVRPSDASAG